MEVGSKERRGTVGLTGNWRLLRQLSDRTPIVGVARRIYIRHSGFMSDG